MGLAFSWSSRAVDTAIAVAATVAGIMAVIAQTRNLSEYAYSVAPGVAPHEVGLSMVMPSPLILLGVVLTTAPLAVRRRYPIAVFCVILTAVFATHNHVTVVTFLAVVFAAYSAVAYSGFRLMAVLTVFTGGVIVTAAFPDTTPPIPARYGALLVLLLTATIAVVMRGWRERVGDSAERLRRVEAEHEAETRRAVEAERARIASELHDVVTHNVSVMVVQAGAARRVLSSSPGEARQALLAVEASGRTAMTELRHLLGLLAPSDAVLVPQPDLGQVGALVERVRAAGLPVELTVTGVRPLPPGVDLAAYRVVQEGLTNVLKHAGQARADVRIEYLPCELRITVSDDGRLVGAPAGGHGLIGLRERIAVYRGELDAGPLPGGGWRLAARIPLEDAMLPVRVVAG
jgi:signal transduction histidine kinase